MGSIKPKFNAILGGYRLFNIFKTELVRNCAFETCIKIYLNGLNWEKINSKLAFHDWIEWASAISYSRSSLFRWQFVR